MAVSSVSATGTVTTRYANESAQTHVPRHVSLFQNLDNTTTAYTVAIFFFFFSLSLSLSGAESVA